MSPHLPAKIFETKGCSVVLRRVEGPEADELFFSCRPSADTPEATKDAESVYLAVLSVLEQEGANFGSVVSETLFLRDLAADIE